MLLAVGTYAMRAGGGEIGERLAPYPRVQVAMEDAAFLILASVVATTALTDGSDFGGFARVLGIGLSGVLAWRGVSLPIEIGRASCRERGEEWGGGGEWNIRREERGGEGRVVRSTE